MNKINLEEAKEDLGYLKYYNNSVPVLDSIKQIFDTPEAKELINEDNYYELYKNIFSANGVSFSEIIPALTKILLASGIPLDNILNNLMSAIPSNCFRTCSALEEIEIPENIEIIGKSAFYRCPNLAKVKIPKTLKVIEEGAFKDCFSLFRHGNKATGIICNATQEEMKDLLVKDYLIIEFRDGIKVYGRN